MPTSPTSVAGRTDSSCRSRTRSRAAARRSNATSSPSASSDFPGRNDMDFSLTDDQELLRDTATKLLDRECPPALVRAHIDDPSVYEPLWRHLSEYTALGTGPATDLCLFLAQTGYVAAPGPFLATALFASLTGDDEHTGTVAFRDDAMNPFVLEADRVERIAIVKPGRTVAVVDTDVVVD